MSDSLAVLLHAKARGARLQHYCPSFSIFKGDWENVFDDEYPSKKDVNDWRIHPKDEHLRYGTISSALVESAKNPFMPEYSVFPSIWPISMLWQLTITEYYRFAEADQFTKSLFLLLVAESLIEDGL